MAFISLKDFLSILYFKLIGLIGPRAVSERVKCPLLIWICQSDRKEVNQPMDYLVIWP
jgi:hypothetical protein